MPIPIIIGAAVLAAGAYGAKKGYDGNQKHSEADEIVKSAQNRYDRKKAEFEEQEKDTQTALASLGKLELRIGKSFGDFKTLADSLLDKLRQDGRKDLTIHLPRQTLQRVENYSYSAIGVLGSAVGAGAAGVAAGFAVYSGVMALGAASTGTAISSLAGVAATNATLAAIGGGSLAAGGLGIAGGIAVLGAAVAAPVLAIAGWAYDRHGEEALKNARRADCEVDNAIAKLDKAGKLLCNVEDYSRRIKRTLTSIFGHFNQYFDNLKNINTFVEDLKGRSVDVEAELAKHGDEIIQAIENGYALAALLTDLITTPIFKVQKKNGKVVRDADGVPQMEKDADGSMILNDAGLEDAIAKARDEAGRYTAA